MKAGGDLNKERKVSFLDSQADLFGHINSVHLVYDSLGVEAQRALIASFFKLSGCFKREVFPRSDYIAQEKYCRKIEETKLDLIDEKGAVVFSAEYSHPPSIDYSCSEITEYPGLEQHISQRWNDGTHPLRFILGMMQEGRVGYRSHVGFTYFKTCHVPQGNYA